MAEARQRRGKKEGAPPRTNGAASDPPKSKYKMKSKEFPLVPLGAFFAAVFLVLGSVYRKFGPTMFFGHAAYDLSRTASEWRSFLDGYGEGGRGKTVLLIGGPHRGGTTILWKALTAHPEISGLGDTFRTGSDHSEGINIQDVYPRFGVGMEHLMKHNPKWQNEMTGVGRYALGDEKEVHLTEDDERVTPENMARIMNRFGSYWNLSTPVLTEKSPPTAVMSRFLQALYNLDPSGGGEGKRRSVTKFLFITRHPLANAYAQQDLLGGSQAGPSLETLLKNYVQMHKYLKSDMEVLENDPKIVRLEDFASDPNGELRAIYEWLGVDSSDDTVRWILEEGLGEKIRSEPNKKYQSMWCRSDGKDGTTDWWRYVTAEEYQKDVDELGLGYDMKGWCRGGSAGTKTEKKAK